MVFSGSPELAAAIEAAARAAEVIMRYYGREVATRTKADDSPVTQADVEAEQVIIEYLRKRFPEHGFLSEEGGDSDSERESVWVIDPIDGTKNFVRGIPIFGTQIAFTRGGVPVLGVSRLPALGETLFAEVGGGAHLNGERVRVSEVSELSAASASFGGLNHFLRHGRTDALLNLAAAAGRSRGFGDAYAYHLLATGRCDIVTEAHIRYWDVAALAVIIQEAGGRCSTLAGLPIDRHVTDIVCTNGSLHAAVLSALGSSGGSRLGGGKHA
jgi:histidinol-phosphatase